MKIKPSILAFAVILIYSCGSSDNYTETIGTDTMVDIPVEQNKESPSELLARAKAFAASKEYESAQNILRTIIYDYSTSPEKAEADSISRQLMEDKMWDAALETKDPSFTETYLENYKNGKYSGEAKVRLKELFKFKEKNDYERALSLNSSTAWLEFLNNYPNRKDKADIRERIIRAEVDEIMRSESTGKIPESDKINGRYSATSTISIKNDTNCELIVRYSGVEAKMVSIPSGGTRSLNLSSGKYDIAASACGYNYAGTETLSGSYSSSYYITTSRY